MATSLAWFSIWPIARTAMLLVFRRKLFWLLFAVAMLSFIFTFGAPLFSLRIDIFEKLIVFIFPADKTDFITASFAANFPEK